MTREKTRKEKKSVEGAGEREDRERHSRYLLFGKDDQLLRAWAGTEDWSRWT